MNKFINYTQQQIKDKMAISISSDQIYKWFKRKIRIIAYKDICKYDNIEDLIGKYNRVIILYEIRPSYGHWVCLYKNEHTVYYFDSAGAKPEAYLKYTPPELAVYCKKYHTYLILLIYESSKNFEYNQYKLQSEEKGINTCGRWCTARLMNLNISVNDFHKIFISNKKYTPDELVTMLTYNL